METTQFEEAKNSYLKIEEHIFTFDHIANYATDILVFADLEKAGFSRKDKQILTEALSCKPYFYYQFFTFRDCKKDRYVCFSSSIRTEAPQLFSFFLSNYDPESNIIDIELGTFDDGFESNTLNELIEGEVEAAILKFSHNLDFQSKRIEGFLDYHYYKFNGSPYEWLDYVLGLFNKLSTNEVLKIRLKNLFNEWKTAKVRELSPNEEEKTSPSDGKEKKKINKGVGKSSPTLTHKQQMVLLEKLGILDVPIFDKLTTEQKANILGNLLNRNLQDTRELLTYYGGKIDKDHPKTDENIKKVNELLKENNLEY